MKNILITCAVVFCMTAAQPVNAQTVYYTPSTDIAVLEAYIVQLQSLLAELRRLERTSVTYYTPTTSSGSSEIAIYTSGTDEVDDESVTLKGKVDFGRSDEAAVWFEYGRSRGALTEQTIAVVLDEDDDEERFTTRISDLREETTYYYRAVGEDEDGAREYGSIYSFKTSDESRRNDDEPEVDTDRATNITDFSAKLRGDVDMNDFKNGLVFFVYGEDEDLVEDIADDYDEYRDIDEDGDDLQKVLVDSNLDDDSDYYYTAYNLDDDTDIYFSLCVEFEDEDDDELIICGDVEEFETD